jgi:hypothetical protein
MCFFPKFTTKAGKTMEYHGSCVTVRTFITADFGRGSEEGGILISVDGQDPHTIQFVDRSIRETTGNFALGLKFKLKGDDASKREVSEPGRRFHFVDAPSTGKPCPYYDCNAKGETGGRPVKRTDTKLSMFDLPASSLHLLVEEYKQEVGIFVARTFCIADGKSKDLVTWKMTNSKFPSVIAYDVAIKSPTPHHIQKYRQFLTTHGFDPKYLPDP